MKGIAFVLAVLALAPTPLAQYSGDPGYYGLAPTTWNVTGAYTRAETATLAQGAIDVFTKAVYPVGTMSRAISSLNTTLAQNSLIMLYAIARKDYVAGAQDNQGYVTGELGSLFQNDTWYLATPNGVTHSAGPRLQYALACLEAFRAYGGDELHQKAWGLWSDVQQLQVNSTDIASGKHNGTAFLTECYGEPVLGAVADYWPLGDSNVSVIQVGSFTTNKFLTLSARLAALETPNTASYNATLQGALLAEQFREKILTRFGSPGCALFYADLAPTGSCVVDPYEPASLGSASSDCSTWFAEGLSVLNSIRPNNTREDLWQQQMAQLFTASDIPASGVLDDSVAWGPAGGANVVPDSISTKCDILLPLSEVYNYSVPQDSSSMTLAFASVQLNALMTNATQPGSNVYGNWSGPPANTPTLNGMSAAIAALVAAIGTMENPPPSETPHFQPGPDRLLSPSAIAGIIIGGVMLLVCTTIGVLWLRRRRRRRRLQARAFVMRPEDSRTATEVRTMVSDEKRQMIMVSDDQTPVSSPTITDLSPFPPPGLTTFLLPALPMHIAYNAESPSNILPVEIGVSELPENVFRKDDANSSEPPEDVFRKAIYGGSAGPEPLQSPESSSASNVAEEVQQLLRRADDTPNAHAADLRRRLTELGPIPEVLEALQDLLRSQGTNDGDLPRYEQAAGNG